MNCVDTSLLAQAGHAAGWATLPLAPGGRSLVEASAGTGKTWTISVLYLRLLLEGDAPVSAREIAVTTFTDAAAQELGERLRRRVEWAARNAERTLEGEAPAEAGDDAQWLLARWRVDGLIDATSVRRDLNRLRLAQSELDLAPIGTLHAFCRRVLSEYPFECGHAFGLAETADARALDAELFADVWRSLVQNNAPLDAGAQAWVARGRAALERALRDALAPGVSLRAPDADALKDDLTPATVERLRALAQKSNFQSRKTALLNALVALTDAIESDTLDSLGPTPLKNLLAPVDEQVHPDHLARFLADPGFAAARRIAGARRHADAPALAATLERLRDRVRTQRDAWLRERGQLTFDAQIERVRAALQGEQGPVLAARLVERWPAMLVDEFQDTDAQQYAIVDRIYRDNAGAARGRLVMIGDPKQAIYRFRGGDIHAYLRARRDAGSRLTLHTNFRSSRAMVAGLNEWYGLATCSLGGEGDDRIDVPAIAASGGPDAQPLLEHGSPIARPLVFHLQPDIPPNADARRDAALQACARHIASMLETGGFTLGGAALQPGDLAVLLPTNADVARLRGLLRARGVPCVGSGRDSVFATPIARDLQVFLYGVEHANHEPAVRAALATGLGGATWQRLREWRDDSVGWQAQLQRFARLRARWHAVGVLAVVRDVVAGGAAGFAADSERALTDLRHLAELLQEASERLDGPSALLAWFAEQREPGEGDPVEEQQLRIESDARRVRLMTLHASKGLEFSVVFLPLMWAHTGRAKTDWPLVHDAQRGGRVMDMGTADFDDALAQTQLEDQQERHRVLYVALTRARHACHVYVLPCDRPTDGKTARPPSDPVRSALDAAADCVQRRLGSLQGLDDVTAHVGITLGWAWPEAKYSRVAAPRPAHAQALDEPVTPRLQGKHSFSTLVRAVRLTVAEESAASDEAPVAVEIEQVSAIGVPAMQAPDPTLDALSAVRGTEFGNALHAIFELRRIGEPLETQHALVRRCLLDAGVRSRSHGTEALVPLVAERVQAALDAELLPGLRLGELPQRALRAEMEFHFELTEVSMRALRTACETHGDADLVPPLALPRLSGLLTGKIDLVLQHDGRFHVLDYKGNYVGAQLADYDAAALRGVMDAHHYRFQALLYTVAVDRYLRQRKPDYCRQRELGEAIYLFVRAAGLAPGAGVWTHRFDDGLLDAVDRVLAEGADA